MHMQSQRPHRQPIYYKQLQETDLSGAISWVSMTANDQASVYSNSCQPVYIGIEQSSMSSCFVMLSPFWRIEQFSNDAISFVLSFFVSLVLRVTSVVGCKAWAMFLWRYQADSQTIAKEKRESSHSLPLLCYKWILRPFLGGISQYLRIILTPIAICANHYTHLHYHLHIPSLITTSKYSSFTSSIYVPHSPLPHTLFLWFQHTHRFPDNNILTQQAPKVFF